MSTLSDPDEPECMEEVNISNQDGSRVEDDVHLVKMQHTNFVVINIKLKTFGDW